MASNHFMSNTINSRAHVHLLEVTIRYTAVTFNSNARVRACVRAQLTANLKLLLYIPYNKISTPLMDDDFRLVY
jgi:ribosomal protein S12